MAVASAYSSRTTSTEGADEMTDVADFGAPVKVAERPPSPTRGGRQSLRPAYEKWLTQLEPGAEFEMASKDEDGAHAISRLNTLRKVAKELNEADGATMKYKVDAVPVVANKRYRIFGSVVPNAPAGKK